MDIVDIAQEDDEQNTTADNTSEVTVDNNEIMVVTIALDEPLDGNNNKIYANNRY